MTIFSQQSNRGERNAGRRLRSVGAIALGWVVFLGCAADLDRNGDYECAFSDSTEQRCSSNTGLGGATGQGGGGNAQGGGGNAQGGSSMVTTAPPDPSCLADMISANGCTGCHGSSADIVGAHLDLSKPNIGQRILNKASDCATNSPLIDGSNLMNSTFLKKVTNVATGCNGTAMPPGTTGLSGTQLQCVKDWITSFH